MSDPNKIPRADSKLKNLPAEVQEQLYAKVLELKSGGLRQEEALPWLRKEHGIKSSTGSLSDFLSWYSARLLSRDRHQRVLALLEKDRATGQFSDEELFQRGQRFFAELTIAEEDAKGWASVHKTTTDRQSLDLDRKKFKRETLELFVKWSADKRAAEILSSGATHEEKLKALDQTLFPEDWAK